MADSIEKMSLNSKNISEDQKTKLNQLFPEIFTEDKIDFDKLKMTLGKDIDTGQERYGMTWPGKADCFKVIQEPSIGSLKPCREESINFNETENLFIEGDNLEVLKLLQSSYYAKIKMIYIDPPYNTGKEFIYPDKYKENLDTYLNYTEQVDTEGRKFSTNTETDGRYHSKWINMMYPRLFLARNLLRDDGVIFISIDDHEVTNLRKMCDEIFGEENFVAQIAWEKRFTRSNNAKMFANLKETVLCYRKSQLLEYLREPRNEKADSIYSNPDNDRRGPWTSVSYVNPATKEQRPNLVYSIKNPFTGETIEHPKNAWKYEKKVYDRHVEEKKLYWGKMGNNTYPRLKKFLSEMEGGMVPVDLWHRQQTGTTDEGSKELEGLFGIKIFDFPKPSSLIRRAIKIASDNGGIILDFFSGTSPTAHAVLDLNKSDNGNRKFIMVQLPEPCDEKTEAYKAGYKTIADIGKERIRRVISKIQEEQSSQLDLDQNNLDLGFKVFKLDKSNFRIWDGAIGEDTDDKDIEKQIELHIDHINPQSSDEDILYELLIKSGFQLTTKIEEIELAGKKVYSIEDGALLICLDRKLTKEVISEMARLEPARIICLDEGFAGNDQLKTNAVQIMKSFNVNDFRTV